MIGGDIPRSGNRACRFQRKHHPLQVRRPGIAHRREFPTRSKNPQLLKSDLPTSHFGAIGESLTSHRQFKLTAIFYPSHDQLFTVYRIHTHPSNGSSNAAQHHRVSNHKSMISGINHQSGRSPETIQGVQIRHTDRHRHHRDHAGPARCRVGPDEGRAEWGC